MIPSTPKTTLFPYTTLFRSQQRLMKQQQLKQKKRTAVIDVVLSSPEEQLQMDIRGQVVAEIARLNKILVLLRSEEHTSELQSPMYLVCRLLLEKKKKKIEEK